MPSESFALYTKSRSLLDALRARAATTPEAAAELMAAIEHIRVLWEALHEQSEALAEERQRHAEFFEFAPDAYVITEPHGEIREANRAARELLHFGAEGADGRSIVDWVAHADQPAFRRQLVAARGHPEGQPEEWRARLLDGGSEAREVSLRVRPIKVRRKNAEGLCWLLRRY